VKCSFEDLKVAFFVHFVFHLITENICIRGTVWNTKANTMGNRKRGNAYAKHRNWYRNTFEHYSHDGEFV
ncbi:MAG: hypothetical protein KBS34_00695, partial [Phascolarctobacterium sp.]|nr:hypothetical protein [Candidatus Phascolarctobacterium equi]